MLGLAQIRANEGAMAALNPRWKSGAELADPIKTTIVQNQRAMTTWVMRKAA